MGFREWLFGPNESEGEFRPKNDLAKVHPDALNPNDRDTPGLYYSGRLVKEAKNRGLIVNRELVDQVVQIAEAAEANQQNMKDFKVAVGRLSKAETATVKEYSQMHVKTAMQHAYQNREHNKMLRGLDKVSVQCQKNRTKRISGADKARQAIAKMQQQQRLMKR